MPRAVTSAVIGLLAGLLSVGDIGCERSDRQRPAPDFFPLHADDSWVYEVLRPVRNERTRMTVRVRDERYIPSLGRRCRLVDETYAIEGLLGSLSGRETPPRVEMHPVAYYRKDGFLYRSMSFDYRGQELLDTGIGSVDERFLPDGLGHGIAWESSTTAYDLGGGIDFGVGQTHWTASTAESVDVPAGRFGGCVRVDTVALHGSHRRDKGQELPVVLYYTDWYAPDVGLVRSQQSDQPGGGTPAVLIELLSYHVATAAH